MIAPGAGAAPVVLQEVVKTFGGRRAVDRVSIEVPAGSIYGLLGPNGSGKTTTIRILMSLVRRDSGRVGVLGVDPEAAGPGLRSQIGYLPGELGLPENRRAADVLKVYRDLSGVGAPLFDWACEVLEMSKATLNGQMRFFSKGMKQKVGIIQALQHGPRLLILDEPTTGLDPVIQARFFAALQELKKAGSTVLLSSHVLSEVQAACDRVAILKQGALAQEGPVSRVLVTGDRRLYVARTGAHAERPPAIEGAVLEEGPEFLSGDAHWWHYRTSAVRTPQVLQSLAMAHPDDFRLESLLEESFLELYREAPSGPR